MKRMAVASTFVLGVILFCSCRKSKSSTSQTTDTPQPSAPVYASYSALKTGNYWVYGQTGVNGSSPIAAGTDSSYVSGDTLIGGFRYYKYFNGFLNSFTYLRDSLHYIMDSNGRKIFSSQDFTSYIDSGYTILNNPPAAPDTMYRHYVMMNQSNPNITVPAGNFSVLDAQKIIHQYKGQVPSGIVDPKVSHAKYASHVGLVYDTYVFSTSNYYVERKLLRYHLN